jgi:hypothetical protein
MMNQKGWVKKETVRMALQCEITRISGLLEAGFIIFCPFMFEGLVYVSVL